jgi:DNA polymerase-1
MRILLIDLASAWWRNASITIPDGDLSRKDGDPIGMTMRQLEDVAPDYDGVAVAIDGPPYWRSQEYPDYKGQRPDHDPGIVELYKALGRRIKAKWPILYCKGFEADDMIATACRQLSMADALCTIVTADKDMYQLLREGEIDVLNVATPADKDPLWTQARLVETHGLQPDQWALYLALMGDTSDNLPGVKGIGEKTAKRILTDSHAMLPKAIKADHMTPKQWESLLATQPDLTLQHRLTTLRADVPIDVLGKLNMAARTAKAAEQSAVEHTEPEPQEWLKEKMMAEENETEEPDIAAMGGPTSSSLDGALLEAQRMIKSVRKASKTDFGPRYNYASAEDMIAESRRALIAAGLIVYREGRKLCYRTWPWSVPIKEKYVTTDGTWVIASTWRMSHPKSGESRTVETEYPIVVSAGRPLDKATNGALSTEMGYFYRDVLQIPRVENEVCARDDEEPPQRWNDHRRA